ncbi:MAG: pentapeptide repeat-containing protein [Candidatus Rickettsia vulgarisii]
MAIVISDIKIEKYVPSDDDIAKYIQVQRNNITANLTLNQYLKEQYFKNTDVVVAADLSDRAFSEVDLSGGDFTGCIFKNTSFKKCNLANSVFCDVDFDNAYFEETILRNIDFRGADLASCRFSDQYKDYSNFGKEQDIAGIKFSTTADLGRKYADIKSDMIRAQGQKEMIKNAQKALDEAYGKLSMGETVYYALGRETGNAEYDRLHKELKLMTEKKIFPEKDNPMHKSFQNIFSSESYVFDPSYVRGSTKEERDRENQLVKLGREDVIEYLEKRKTNKDLSLNDFVKTKLKESEIKPNARVIADLSSRIDYITNKWHDRVDLSGLDFAEADLQGVLFSGSILSGCKFSGANISKANFESCELEEAKFVNVKADNANFFNSNISKTSINHCQFTHAYMPRSNGLDIKITDQSNFDYANIKNARWDYAQVADSTFNYANLEGISLISADLRRIKMQHAILNNAVLAECNIVESDLSNSFMQSVDVHKAKIKNSILEKIEAKGINLSKAELNKLTKLDGANLEGAILELINAEGASFVKANLNQIKAENANFKKAILQEVDMKFANLKGAVLESANAYKINVSYSILENVKARGAGFSDSVARRIEGKNADFTEVNFTNTDLTRSKLQSVILEKVQAEKARLEGVNLRKAKLREANIAGAEIDLETNIVEADLKAVQGDFIQNGQKVKPQELQIEQEKADLEKNKNAPSKFNQFATSCIDLISVLGPTAKSIPEIKKLYDNFNKFQDINQKLLSNKLLVDERQNLQSSLIEAGSNLIQGASIVLNKYVPTLNKDQSNILKDTIANYALLPVLKELLNPTPMLDPTKPERVNPDIFEGVDQQFTRRAMPVLINLSAAVLDGECNKRVKDIYKDLITLNKDTIENITKNAAAILTDSKVAEVLQNEFAAFLQNPENHKEITKIAGNYLDDRVTRFMSKELFANTVSLAASITPPLLKDLPKIYQSYMKHQELSADLLSGKDLSDDQKQTIIEQQKPIVSDILDNSQKIIKNISSILKSDLPKYFEKSQNNILNFLAKTEIQQNIRSYGVDPKLVYDVAEATVPFVVEILPIVSDFVENCLNDKEGLEQIITQTKIVMNSLDAEKAKELKKLVNSLIEFKNHNPEVASILQEKIPELLVKHSESLGPITERLLNETEVGRNLKLKGEKVVKAIGEHTTELGVLTTLYNKKEYGKMIKPLWNVLSDTKVLSLVVQGGVNFCSYIIQKKLVSNPVREKLVGSKMNKIMEDILKSSASLPESNIRSNLDHLFQEKLQEIKGDNKSSIIDYSLRNKDLQGISFTNTDMKLDNYEIKSFNFNKVEFVKASFKNSLLQDCSFKDVSFKEPVDFDGVTIDEKTLLTLLPAIQKYNKSNSNKIISLKNIKIIGKISNKVKSNPMLSNADFSEATLIESKKQQNNSKRGYSR